MSHNIHLPKLIAMTGFKRSGKDTGAKYLIEKYGYIRYAFADALKVACSEIFMLSKEQLDGNEKETSDERWGGLSARKIFQGFGTEMMRHKLGEVFPELKELSNNLWTYRFELWYKDLLKKNPNARVIVTDLRFANEEEILKKYNAFIIKVNRSSITNIDNHQSEMGILQIKEDVLLKNDSTIDDYYNSIEDLFN